MAHCPPQTRPCAHNASNRVLHFVVEIPVKNITAKHPVRDSMLKVFQLIPISIFLLCWPYQNTMYWSSSMRM